MNFKFIQISCHTDNAMLTTQSTSSLYSVGTFVKKTFPWWGLDENVAPRYKTKYTVCQYFRRLVTWPHMTNHMLNLIPEHDRQVKSIQNKHGHRGRNILTRFSSMLSREFRLISCFGHSCGRFLASGWYMW